jgi:RecA-family ATPase
MQLAAAHVLGKDWLGTLPEPGPAVYVNAEDEEGELHRRLAPIAGHFGASLTELKNDLYIVALAGKDSVLGYPDRTGRIIATSLFHKLAEAARTIRPKLIVLDTSADIFAGNENDRSQVRQFISLLRNMAIEAGAAIILCAHPSLTGMNSGSGLSGSTAWHNSVRARAYLRAATTQEGAEPDKDLRLLEFMKSNYGPVAESVRLRWRNGVFVLEPKAGSLKTVAADAKADEAFMQVLNRFCRQGRNASPNPGRTYAPSLFASEPEANGLAAKNLAAAMVRLFSADKIHVVKEGPPSHQRSRLVVGPAPHSNAPSNAVPTPSNGVCVPPP